MTSIEARKSIISQGVSSLSTLTSVSFSSMAAMNSLESLAVVPEEELKEDWWLKPVSRLRGVERTAALAIRTKEA